MEIFNKNDRENLKETTTESQHLHKYVNNYRNTMSFPKLKSQHKFYEHLDIFIQMI